MLGLWFLLSLICGVLGFIVGTIVTADRLNRKHARELLDISGTLFQIHTVISQL